MGCKPASTPMETNVNLSFDDNHTLDDSERYRRLIGKLISLIVIRPNITFVVGYRVDSCISPEVHCTAALRILAYVKSSPEKGLLY